MGIFILGVSPSSIPPMDQYDIWNLEKKYFWNLRVIQYLLIILVLDILDSLLRMELQLLLVYIELGSCIVLNLMERYIPVITLELGEEVSLRIYTAEVPIHTL